ncbi:hypothetical protein [Natrinema altunense]|uniref:Uncharacterized protein n=1 Tax=Natrinema altunense (strain JCM 12890 / CGMCC 1.3731 / AJ2) TaxID=1227494 RepID=L9ZC80_NATA2|nr:hypothetical protein [Natrinema altunense]ELY83611.1 hypothetical protein C485_17702 [Natrinema altunense JCM 12890]
MGEATIYYLNWDEEAEDHGPASELFHKYGVESVLDEDEMPPSEFSEEEFEEFYREVATVEGDYEHPEQLWREWNRGSREESQEFYDAEVRSMSVGDVVELDGDYYLAKAIGFDEIEVGGGQE